MSTIIYHNHHIIPKYRCKEIGIHPDFEGNVIRLTRKEHAVAHYHRWLKHGRKEDLGAAQFLARGEIEELPIPFGKDAPFYGKKHSIESRKKMSIAGKGRVLSEKIKKNMSEAAKKKIFTEEHKRNIAAANSVCKKGENHPSYGKKRSSETLEKMSIAQTKRFANKEDTPFYGKKHSDETKKKMSESHKKSWRTRK